MCQPPIASLNHYPILQQPLLRQHMATQNRDTWQKWAIENARKKMSSKMGVYTYISYVSKTNNQNFQHII